MVDERGEMVDGDGLLYILATDRLATKTLQGPVVGTVMTNLGLELALNELGIEFHRAKVGDRQVLAMLRERGGILGGETSGHLLCLDKTTTGDGLITALQVLAVLKKTGKSLSELVRGMKRLPQILLNVEIDSRIDVDSNASIGAAVKAAESKLDGRGRVVLRASGTEPLIRVMVEGEEEELVNRLAQDLADSVRAAVG
jgi:phosphoglucosamine mutase